MVTVTSSPQDEQITPSNWVEFCDFVKTEEVSKCLAELQSYHSAQSNPKSTATESTNTAVTVLTPTQDVFNITVGKKPYINNIIGEVQETSIVIDLETLAKPESIQSEIPCELAIVLDVSGSMFGSPLDYSKQAIIKIVDSLSDGDLLHFITYSNNATTSFSGKMTFDAKLEAKKKIMEARAAGGTDIVSGIVEAVKSISYADTASHNNKRIFLFTDGEVNEGICKHIEIAGIVRDIQANFSINFTTFGFGSSFDEPLMRAISQAGNGDYFYIADVKDIDYKVSKGLLVLQSLLGINAKLSFYCIDSPHASVRMTNIKGYQEYEAKTSVGQAVLGDLCYDDLRQILSSFEITVLRTSEQPIEILRYSLEYEVINADGSTSPSLPIEGSVSVEVTDDEEKLSQLPDSLRVALTLAEVSANDKLILANILKKAYEESITIQQRNLEMLSEVLSVDNTGVVHHLIALAEVTLQKLKTDRSKSLERDVGYSSYRGSIVHRKCF